MSFVMIPEELLDVDLSAAQFRALIHIINNTYSTGKYAGCCCLGYRILADRCFTDKSAMIKTIRQLEQLGFVEVDKREKFNRSNALKLTLENGLKRCSSGMAVSDCSSFYGCQKPTDDRCQKPTDDGCQNTTQGCLKTTLGCQNTTPHIDLKFKNLDLKNKNACARAEHGCLKTTDEEKKTAPADGAAGRSMPNGGQAAESSAGNGFARPLPAKEKMPELVEGIRSYFVDIFDDLSLSTWNNQFILRKKGKFALIEDVRLKEVAEWLSIRDYAVKIMPTDCRLAGEVLIEEAV